MQQTDHIAALNEPLPLDIPDEDKMFEQIDQWARQSIAHWRRQIRGQQITRGDSGDYHLIMATLRWVKEHPMEPPKVLSAEEVTKPGWYWVRNTRCPYWKLRYVAPALGKGGTVVGFQFVGPLKAPEV